MLKFQAKVSGSLVIVVTLLLNFDRQFFFPLNKPLYLPLFLLVFQDRCLPLTLASSSIREGKLRQLHLHAVQAMSDPNSLSTLSTLSPSDSTLKRSNSSSSITSERRRVPKSSDTLARTSSDINDESEALTCALLPDAPVTSQGKL
jgi:hypothetical protein